MIDELEKLARAALDTDRKSLPYRALENQKFKAAANPAAILELINHTKSLESAVDKLIQWALHEVGVDPELTPGLSDAIKLMGYENE